MNMSELLPDLLASGAILLLAFSLWAAIARNDRRLAAERARGDELQQQLELARQSIRGLTTGAVGVDRRVGRPPRSRVRARTRITRTGWMNMFELLPNLLASGAILLLAISLWAAIARNNRRLAAERARGDELQQQLELARQSIRGLTTGAVGVDRRVGKLEARERLLSERQETYEIQQADEQPYGHAIRMVQQGAGVGRLVQELELSESEADLIVRLHGQRDSA